MDLLIETKEYNNFENFEDLYYSPFFLIFIRQKTQLFFLISSFLIVCFGNPGIIIDKQYSEEEIKKKYKDLNRFIFCKKCHMCIPRILKPQHCDFCGICIESHNHHSFIFGKCVGKYTYVFYLIFILFSTLTTVKILLVFFSRFILQYINYIRLYYGF